MTQATVLIISFLVLSILGTLLHFTHNWIKSGVLLHMFSALNESTWEHMKLLVAPTILVAIFQKIMIGSIYNNLWSSLLVLFVVELISIPLLYEILKLFKKEVPLFLTILLFYLAILLGIVAEYVMMRKGVLILSETFSFVIISIIVFLFAIFSYFPPKTSLFKDPVTKRWGDI